MYRDFFYQAKPLTRDDVDQKQKEKTYFKTLYTNRSNLPFNLKESKNSTNVFYKSPTDLKIDLSMSISPLCLDESMISDIGFIELRKQLSSELFIKALIKLQALIRGFLLRKKLFSSYIPDGYRLLLQFKKLFYTNTINTR